MQRWSKFKFVRAKPLVSSILGETGHCGEDKRKINPAIQSADVLISGSQQTHNKLSSEQDKWQEHSFRRLATYREVLPREQKHTYSTSFAMAATKCGSNSDSDGREPKNDHGVDCKWLDRTLWEKTQLAFAPCLRQKRPRTSTRPLLSSLKEKHFDACSSSASCSGSRPDPC